jgi:poly(beta-D-mannuronate) lyase
MKSRIYRVQILALFITLWIGPGQWTGAAEVMVSDAESARKAVRDAAPGDRIILAAGDWRDVDLRLDGEGTAEAPITIQGGEGGGTKFVGASRVRLGGSHLVLRGLQFHNLSGSQADWLEYRIDSKRLASHCRVTDCLFVEDAGFTAAEKENRWIGIYGEANQLDHCRIEGKKNKGATVVVWLGEVNVGRHHIYGNYFGPRPRLGKNGGETLRVGDSESSMQMASCLVEGNLFFQCDGETECISNKSCGNIYRGNTFREVQGTLTLRHGNDCLVEGNVFLGEKRSQTGGIRVIGERHVVRNNTLLDLEGDGFRSALVLLRGLPDSPLNGYFPVKGAEIIGNRVQNCKHSLVIGYHDDDEAVIPPRDCSFVGNSILAREGLAAVEVLAPQEGATWRENLVSGALRGIEAQDGLASGNVVAEPAPIGLTRESLGLSEWIRGSAPL